MAVNLSPIRVAEIERVIEGALREKLAELDAAQPTETDCATESDKRLE